MRSLVQEAATIEKAIHQAWQKAGKPQQFQVKVLEEPERNFFGMVTRSGKIALFFQEQAVTQAQHQQHDEKKRRGSRQQRKQSKAPQKEQSSDRAQKQEKQSKQEHTDVNKKHKPEPHKPREKQPEKNTEQGQEQQKKQSTRAASDKKPKQDQKKPQSLWTHERVEHARTWLRDVLDNMGYHNISFTAEPQNLYLRIELSDRLLTRKDQEKQLLASLASLMMATMQRKYNKAFRGHKVVLTHP